MRGYFSGFGGFFGLEVLLTRVPVVLGVCSGGRRRVGDDYGLIATRRGWMPRMFMTRVRL